MRRQNYKIIADGVPYISESNLAIIKALSLLIKQGFSVYTKTWFNKAIYAGYEH